VEKQGRLLFAKEPPQGWFHYKKNTNLPWQKRLSNFPMYRLRRDAGDQRLTNLQNAVLCLLHSWQKRITAQGLATQLRCGKRSVYRAADALQAMGLLDSFWTTTISRRHLSLWQDKQDIRQPSKGESQPLVCEQVMELRDWPRHNWSRFGYCGSQDRFIDLLNLSQVRMAHGNYNAKQIVDYWAWVFEKLQSPTRFDYFVHKLWWKVWKAAEQETSIHRKQGTFSGPNSLGLLRLKTNAAIKALTEKIKTDGWDTLNSWEPDFSLALGA
jgi:Fe2+ or Zn2+ uptake regulation protein